MDLRTLVTLFAVLCVIAILYWGSTQLPLPPVVRVVFAVLLALAGLIYTMHAFGLRAPL